MNDTTELLNRLRDIQEPVAPQGTSLILLAANAMLLLAIVTFLLWRTYRRRNAWRRQALYQLKQAQATTPENSLLQIAKLLRQIHLHRKPGEPQISGIPYLQQLDTLFNTDWFTKGHGRYFGDALYQPDIVNEIDMQQLYQQLHKLIRALPAKQQAAAP